MMRCATALCSAYPSLNHGLIITGILFHDCGKMWENGYPDQSFTQVLTLHGEMLGHIPLGMELINKLWRDLTENPDHQDWQNLQPPSEHVRLHLLHLIASHHGQLDYGSPILPKTPEAIALHHIDNIVVPSIAKNPKNIFFLTADAFGVLPPISKLTPGQAMYHFISGYTAKVAGTEVGVTEPQQTFSACFGAAFLPLHPTKYATLLGEKMRENNVNVWLINTGWSGGSFGVGSRIKLRYTRAMITAAMDGLLDNIEFVNHSVFGLAMPTSVPDVPAELLQPRKTWADKDAYDATANKLAAAFVKNFLKYADYATEEMLAAAPKVSEEV
jgi:ATP-dependent phosphoenolpyruvate carboxykinase